MFQLIKPLKLSSISGYLLLMIGLTVSHSALAQDINYGSEQQLSYVEVDNIVGENRNLAFRRLPDQTWVSYAYTSANNLPNEGAYYETVFQQGNEVRLLNRQCNVTISIYLHLPNPTNLSGKVTYYAPNQAPKLLGSIKRQFVNGVSQYKVFNRYLSETQNTLKLSCPHLLKADEEIATTTPVNTGCNPFDWMGAPWQTSYGPMVPVVVPDPNSPGTHQFHANYGNNNTLKGKIRKDSPCQVYGEWVYPNGNRGEFLFNLQNKNNFTGTWTNIGEDPIGKAVNWTGSR